jgi:hypothetical protein
MPPDLPRARTFKMHLVLALPGLLLAQAADQAVRAPHLARLLAVAGAPAHDGEGLDAMLAAHYGIQHPKGTDCPLAPVRLAALGGDPGMSFWLVADPVTLVAGRDDVRLMGVVHDLDSNDAQSLVAMLNAHFETDGLVFVAPQPDAWFVRAPARVALLTRQVAAVTGRTLRDLLPSGADASTWQRWQSEIQMLLHQHPVNLARERDGRAPANSVWFSEGGTMPPRDSAAESTRTFADSGVAMALAAHANQAARPVPQSLPSVLATVDVASKAIVALDAPVDLDAVECKWAAPAWTALAERRLEALTLLADGGNGAFAWTTRRPSLWRRTALRFAPPDLTTLLAAARAVA